VYPGDHPRPPAPAAPCLSRRRGGVRSSGARRAPGRR
jgi:hypothetical protein